MKNEKEKLIKEIIDIEWKYFTKLNNIGGRAKCQDDKETFVLMRKAQWLTMSNDILTSYLEDIKNSNLLWEKYARMMEYNDPEEYKKISKHISKISEEKSSLILEIMSIYMKWGEEFYKNFPIYSSMGRPLYSEDDSIIDTSLETYLRGEISSYSIKTLKLYREYIDDCIQKNINLVILNMDNIAKLQNFNDSYDVENYYKNNI